MSTVKTEFATRPTLSAEQPRALVDAVTSGAKSAGIAVTIVVVDEAGVTKEMLRMDGAPLDTVRTAAKKAYAAASLGAPSDGFFEAARASRPRCRLRHAGGPFVDRRGRAGSGRRRGCRGDRRFRGGYRR